MKTEKKQELNTLQWKHAWGMRRQRHGGQTATANSCYNTTGLCTWYSSLSGAWGVSWKCFSGYRLFWNSLKQDWDMQQDRWWQWHRCPFGFCSAWSNICSVHGLKALPHSWRTRWFACFRCKEMPTSRLFCQKDLPNAFSQTHRLQQIGEILLF